jgi:hypothetical protein
VAYMTFRALFVTCATFLLFALAAMANAQAPANDGKDKTPPKSEQVSRVTIEVAGGQNDTPIENASVYVKYIEERKLMKDKKLELNVKTNRDGAAHIPAAPMGRVLIQVVADGWKTYGRWYDITDLKQTFKIHLEKPPKWY